MNTDKRAINWQNFAEVQLKLKFAWRIRPYLFFNGITNLFFQNFCGHPSSNLTDSQSSVIVGAITLSGVDPKYFIYILVLHEECNFFLFCIAQ